MTLRYTPFFLLLAVLTSLSVCGQQPNVAAAAPAHIGHDTLRVDSSKQRDIVDAFDKLTGRGASVGKRERAGKFNFSLIPYIGYSLSTGYIADVSGNAGFYTSADHNENLSVIATDFGLDSKSQRLIRARSEMWTAGNEYKVVSDLRFDIYPTDTYGLGTFSKLSDDDPIDYHYLRIYETLLRRIAKSYYAGIGYNLDNYSDITAAGNVNGAESDFMKYGQTPRSLSSGFNLDLLLDNRKNPINPLGGTYASLIFRESSTFLGGDSNWDQLKADFRKYFRLSDESTNVLAVWCIAAFTWGYAPYLDLPATGSDMYNNSGRGYAIGRFRGRDELYLETEYRFGITANGLLGASVFANAESFSGLNTNTFEGVAPAAGAGLRIKVNKHSNTNICIDYGVGINGSRGLFVNLGEVF